MIARHQAEIRESKRPFERLREQFDCLIHGHRDLAPADAYGEVLVECDEEKDLYYCVACGSPVWVTKPLSHQPPHWTSNSNRDRLAAGVF